MKRRVRKIANFFAFNLLFFALYLNFIHKDEVSTPVSNQVGHTGTEAFSENPAVAATQTNSIEMQTEQPAKAAETKPLKLSIN